MNVSLTKNNYHLHTQALKYPFHALPFFFGETVCFEPAGLPISRYRCSESALPLDADVELSMEEALELRDTDEL